MKLHCCAKKGKSFSHRRRRGLLDKEAHMSEEKTSAHSLTLQAEGASEGASGSEGTPVSGRHLLARAEGGSDQESTRGPDSASVSGSASSGDAQDAPLLKAPEEKYRGPLRLVLMGQSGVGKTSLALYLAGLSEDSVDPERLSSAEPYRRRVTLDDEDSTILVYDDWKEDINTLQCEVFILVFSLTDRHTFYRVFQLRFSLTDTHPYTPVVLVGSKSDLVRSREVNTEEAHNNALTFDCVYLELSLTLDHGTKELLETAVRVARGQSPGPGWTGSKPETLASKAKRFLSSLVPRSRERERRSRERGRSTRQRSRSSSEIGSPL